MPDNLVNCLGLIVSIEVLFTCAGLTTMKVRHAVGVAPESKTMITLGVRELDGSPDGRRRFCGNKSEKSRSLPKEARWNSPSGLS